MRAPSIARKKSRRNAEKVGYLFVGDLSRELFLHLTNVARLSILSTIIIVYGRGARD